MTTKEKVEAFLGAASGRRGMGSWREWLRGVLYLIEDRDFLDFGLLDGAEGWGEALEGALKAHGVRFCDVLDYLFPEVPAEGTDDLRAKWDARQHTLQACWLELEAHTLGSPADRTIYALREYIGTELGKKKETTAALRAERNRLRGALEDCRNDVLLAQGDLPKRWAEALLASVDKALSPTDESK